MEASSEGFGELVQSGSRLVCSWHEGEPFYTAGSWRVDDRHEDQGSAQEVRSKGPLALAEADASPVL